jgi:hypothetical protein
MPQHLLFAGHGTLFANFQSAHYIAKLSEGVFVDLYELEVVSKPPLEPKPGIGPQI